MTRDVSLEGEIWSSSGTRLKPDDDSSPGADLLTVEGGNIDSQGPFSAHFNWWQNRVDKLLNAIEGNGILEWSNLTTYNTDDFCKVGRAIYASVSDGNVGNSPSISSEWVPANEATVSPGSIGTVQLSDGAVTPEKTDGSFASSEYVDATASAEADAAESAANAYTDAQLTSFAAGAAGVFADTTAGIAGTTEGDYFNVPSDDPNYIYDVYRHDAGGVATYIGSTISGVFVGETLQQSEQRAEFVALFQDEDGNVPVWLKNGLLAATGVDAETIRKIQEPFAPNVDQSALRVALFQDETGNVPVWLEKGLLGATGVTPELAAYILSQAPSGVDQPLATDGRSSYRLKTKLASLRAGQAAQAKILFVGDSWTERTLIPQAFADALYAEFGQASTGWISAGSDRNALVSPINGVTYSTSGFTLLDEVASATSLDISAIQATGTSATASIGNLVAESVSIYSYDGDGTFRYRVDGGTWVSVVGGGSGDTTKTDITGLTDTAHTIDIDLTGNTGTVRIFGFYSQRSASGIEISKGGNGSTEASQWAARAEDSAAYLPDIDPDMIVVILGTNDSDSGVSSNAFKASMESFISEYTAAAPQASIVLIAPPDNGEAPASLLAEYAGVLNQIAESQDMVELLNIEAMTGDYATMNALGLWLDTKHLNETGAQFIYDAARKYFI